MFCRKCGSANDDNAFRCVSCGQVLDRAVAAMQPGQSIPNYLAHSIIVTLLCCLPLGIPAIVFSAQVNGKIALGDISGAMESSRQAKMFCWIGFGLGLAANVVVVGLWLMGALFTVMHP